MVTHRISQVISPVLPRIVSSKAPPTRPTTARREGCAGFTLVELLVVLMIIGILLAIAVPSYLTFREKAKANTAMTTAEAIRKAAARYALDVGFYPPDVGRGWDPGLAQPLPVNPDTGATDVPVCPQCPANWVQIVQQRWKGPYLTKWPKLTPWGGKYDYNYWPDGAARYGVSVPPGLYVGLQRDYAENSAVSRAGEEFLLQQKLDFDGSVNGESQLRVIPLG